MHYPIYLDWCAGDTICPGGRFAIALTARFSVFFSSPTTFPLDKGTLLGTPNREPQEYSRNIMEYKVGIFLLYTYYILGVPGLGFPVESLYLTDFKLICKKGMCCVGVA